MESTDSLRAELIKEAEALLARPLLLWGRHRQLVVAVRSYLVVMPEEELAKLAGFVLHYKDLGSAKVPDAGPGPGD